MSKTKRPSLVWKPKKSRYYQFDFEVDDERIHGSTKLKDRKEAIAFAREMQEGIKAERKLLGATGPNMTLLAAANRYMEERGNFLANKAMVERCLNWLLDYIGEKTLLRDIDNEVVAKAVNARRSMNRFGNPKLGLVKNSTVNLEVTHMLQKIMVRALKVWSVYLPKPPQWKMHLLTMKQRTRELSVREELLIETARPDLRPILQFILVSGVRRREAAIRWNQVVDEEGVIKVEGKGDKAHEVPITPEIRQLLDEARGQQEACGRHEDLVFTYVSQHTVRTRDGTRLIRGQRYPLTPHKLHRQFTVACKRLGIKDLTIHDLRRTSGGRMQRVTGDIAAVQEHLGHADISQTRRAYTYIPSSTRAERMRRTSNHYGGVKADAMDNHPQ